ncbi:MAG TPA: DUF72 domain-containing protein [Solirubrobacteraceae bacterium]
MIRIGCSGWNYAHWRNGVVYPPKCPPSRWLPTYAEWFDTVEVNATFYRLTKPQFVQSWIEQTPEDFVFTIKGSRYLTHIKRLQERDQGFRRFYDSIAPLAGHPKMGPVLWQLPPDFKRDDDRLRAWLDALPPGRHTMEFRHETWFEPAVLDMLRERNVALTWPDRPTLPKPPSLEPTADFAFIRFHYGARGRRGNYSDTEIDEWAGRIRVLASDVDVFAYFNNDWEGFAVENGKRLRRLLGA